MGTPVAAPAASPSPRSPAPRLRSLTSDSGVPERGGRGPAARTRRAQAQPERFPQAAGRLTPSQARRDPSLNSPPPART